MSHLNLLRALPVCLLAVACATGADPVTPSPLPSNSASASATAQPTLLPTTSASPTTGSEAPTGTPSASPAGTPTQAPAGYAWTQLAVTDGPPAREDHTFTLAADGSAAYLFGGRRGNRTFDDVWRYDLASDNWTQLSPEGSAPAGRFGHVAVWKDGVGLVIWSGQADATTFFADIWAFDPDGLSWTRLPDNGDVPLARYGSCGAIGPDGQLWISHGFTDDQGRFFDTKAYDFASGAWTDHTPDGDVPVLRCLHDCLWTPDGRFVLYGGQTTGAPAIGDIWAYSQPGGTWTQAAAPLAPPRQLYALAELDGRAFIFGGGDRDGRPLGDLWLLDLATLAMVEADTTGSTPAARSGAAFVADAERGRLLLFGGKGRDGELGDLWQLVATP